MSQEVIKVLDNLGQKFGIAVDWTSTNIMPYLQELGGKIVNYEIATSVLWLVVAFIMTSTSIWIIRKCIKKDKVNSDLTIFGFILSIFIGVIFSIMGISQIFDIIQGIYLPEKTILDYILSIKSSIQ